MTEIEKEREREKKFIRLLGEVFGSADCFAPICEIKDIDLNSKDISVNVMVDNKELSRHMFKLTSYITYCYSTNPVYRYDYMKFANEAGGGYITYAEILFTEENILSYFMLAIHFRQVYLQCRDFSDKIYEMYKEEQD